MDGFLHRYELSARRSAIMFKLENTEVIKRALPFRFLGLKASSVNGLLTEKCSVIRMTDIRTSALALAPQLDISSEFKVPQHRVDGLLQL
ncbi:hypothetical protein AVEN_137982-1 [Araneus ventricosus]|uniref:Uncharacterized protein n=1 Tax=Araneus ventricosus TaxID=182803 RepID=A0A4Y2G878_ARAVE|nr:hypothetical protein AVEN_137982-1 [Araneus ventricosus]